MTSPKTYVFIHAAKITRLKYWYFPRANDPKFYDNLRKNQKKVPEPSKSIRKKFAVSQTNFNGQKLYKISPRGNKTDKAFIYIHGGAFVLPIMKTHWQAIADLVARSGQTAFVSLYPMVPDATHDDIQQHIMKVYRHITKTYTPENLSVMGDSAGGSAALYLASTLDKRSQPAHYILFSPAADFGFENPRIDAMEKIDPIIPVAVVRKPLKFYYGDCSPDQSCINLLKADFSNARHMTIFNGGLDVLSDDIAKLHDVLTKQNVPHEYIFEPELFHAWPILDLCESREVREQVAETIR
jgi:acetyl esterase/lipase